VQAKENDIRVWEWLVFSQADLGAANQTRGNRGPICWPRKR
jgi:hypothetical protein